MDMFCVIYYSGVKYQHALFCRQMCFWACCYLIHQVVELQRKDRLFSLNQKEKINQRYMLHGQRSFDNQCRTDQTDLIFGKRKYEVMFSDLILLNLLFRNGICYLTDQVVQLVQMQLIWNTEKEKDKKKRESRATPSEADREKELERERKNKGDLLLLQEQYEILQRW